MLTVRASIDQVWSAHSMHARLGDGKYTVLFNSIANFDREAVSIDVDSPVPLERVIIRLQQNAYMERSTSTVHYDDSRNICWTQWRGAKILPPSCYRITITKTSTWRQVDRPQGSCLSRLHSVCFC